MTDMPTGRATALLVIVWSAVMALGGGLACGWCISRFGELGAVSIVICGALAGYGSRKIMRHASKTAGISQAIVACIAFAIAETCWLHWNTHNGEPSWWEAIRVWPLFLREYPLSALIGAASTAYGAWLAYGYSAAPGPRAREPAGPITPGE